MARSHPLATFLFKVSPLAALLFIVVTLSNCGASIPGLSFVGEGYDLVYGNPDGCDLERGGVDPGIKRNMKVLNGPDDGREAPREVIYTDRMSCSNSTTYDIFNGAKSYQKKCATEVSASAGGGGLLWDVSFSASVGFEEANQQTNKEGNVFFDENVVCNLGAASYRLDVANANGFSVTRDFAASVCDLPDKFSKRAYKKFIVKWGTHVITKVEFGTKYTKRYRMSRKQFFSEAMKGDHSSVSVGGGGLGFHATVSVSVDTFQSEAEQKEEFGESYKEIRKGTRNRPEPIKIELTPIYKFIKNAYFRDDCPGYKKSKNITKDRIAQLRENVQKALKRYPKWVGATPPQVDKNMTIPLTWPVGFYGLPKPASGCPNASNFEWHKGNSYWWKSETERVSAGSHFPAFNTDEEYPFDKMYYCVKTTNDEDALLDWPAGNYRILKKGKKCTIDFTSSGLRLITPGRDHIAKPFVGSADEGYKEGTVPEISVTPGYTDRFYCCRDDGFAANEIFLPTEKPFYLLPASHECQRVRGMKAIKEYYK